MIIFFDKLSKRIIGTIEGRLHNDHVLNNVSMSSSDVPAEQVDKYVVPYEPITEIIEEPIQELRVLDATGKIGTVVTGKKQVERVKEYEPKVPFKEKIKEFETGKEHTTDYDVVTDDDGKVIGFKKRQSQ